MRDETAPGYKPNLDGSRCRMMRGWNWIGAQRRRDGRAYSSSSSLSSLGRAWSSSSGSFFLLRVDMAELGGMRGVEKIWGEGGDGWGRLWGRRKEERGRGKERIAEGPVI